MVQTTERGYGLPLPSELSWCAKVSIDAADLEALQPYLVKGEEGGFGALAPATLRAMPMRDRPAYALAMGFSIGSELIDRLNCLIK